MELSKPYKGKENVKLKRCLSQSKAIFYITLFFGLLLSQFILLIKCPKLLTKIMKGIQKQLR